MHKTSLRKVGGSVMLAVPPAILDLLQLRAGASVGLSIDGDRLVVEASRPIRYSLDELLAQCDPAAEVTDEDRDWIGQWPVGGELL